MGENLLKAKMEHGHGIYDIDKEITLALPQIEKIKWLKNIVEWIKKLLKSAMD